MTTLWISQIADGTVLVSPDPGRREPPEADVDAALLNVGGGVLYWNVLDPPGTRPLAILDDADTAQDWLWAVYGEAAAVAVTAVTAAALGDPAAATAHGRTDDPEPPSGPDNTAAEAVGTPADDAVGTESAAAETGTGPHDPASAATGQDATAATTTGPHDSAATPTVDATPVLPALAAAAARLAYAHWAAAWWPASDIDDIPPLDRDLLDTEIAELSADCEALWSDESTDGDRLTAAEPARATAPAAGYALAAGTDTATRGLPLAEGSCGTDWRRYPAGLVDASEQAVSWRLWRAAAATTVELSIAAAPDLTTEPPPWLRPHARVPGGHSELAYDGDTWHGRTRLPDPPRTDLTVEIYLPGYTAPPDRDPAAATALRHRIRDLARHRLARAEDSDAGLLRAELAAAEATDF